MIMDKHLNPCFGNYNCFAHCYLCDENYDCKQKTVSDGRLNNVESVITSIMGALLCNSGTCKYIKQFIDNSIDDTLKDNEIRIETHDKKYKMIIEEIKGV
jgi:hypothetical protein